ncbi:MAG TPA: PLP-dependent aminotransferase family protein [Lysobacter sp.]|nr:PLP-dependent aminotransferase family protein [Lysobacter sp.]
MWTPDLQSRPGPRYVALADAIAVAVRSGELAPGARLPPRRALARRLGLNLTTVSRAYDLAAEMGLVSGEVGRGTFVRLLPDPGRVPWPAPDATARVDLSSNFPFPAASAAELARALAPLAHGRGAMDLLRYEPSGALPAHRDAGRAWLAGLGVDAPSDRLLITSGAIHAIFVTLLALTRPGDRVLVEDLTSPALIGACNVLGLRAEGIALDAEGMRPDALAAALARDRAKAVVLVPNLQNPTLAVMSRKRRHALVELARRHAVTLIEDDAYGALLAPDERLPPLAALAPERVCYTTSLSKAVAPGLRIGFLLVPAALQAAALSALRVSTWMTSPLLAHVAASWIGDGTAAALAARQREVAARRQALAAQRLAGFERLAHPRALHVWLRLPEPWRADEFAAYVQARGVDVLASGSMAVDPGLRPAAVRISLCNVESEERLDHGLRTVAQALGGRG